MQQVGVDDEELSGATAGSAGQRLHSSSHAGRMPPSAPATIASGRAASTASTLTGGAGSGRREHVGAAAEPRSPA